MRILDNNNNNNKMTLAAHRIQHQRIHGTSRTMDGFTRDKEMCISRSCTHVYRAETVEEKKKVIRLGDGALRSAWPALQPTERQGSPAVAELPVQRYGATCKL